MAQLDIDIDYVAQLAELLQRTGLTEIEIGQGEARIRVAKQVQIHVDVPHTHPAPAASPVAAPAPYATTEAQPAGIDPAHPGLVASPMVGTVYLGSEPGAPPFVSVGEEVQEGATLLIIEAMKVMNSIRAHKSGRITRIFVENAAPVEYGEPLLLIE
jgi:acetyl-CoA carboxylase biotin carboxyl carrier protein